MGPSVAAAVVTVNVARRRPSAGSAFTCGRGSIDRSCAREPHLAGVAAREHARHAAQGDPPLPFRPIHGTIEYVASVYDRVVGLPLDTEVTIQLDATALSIGPGDVRFTFRRTGSEIRILSFERAPPPERSEDGASAVLRRYPFASASAVIALSSEVSMTDTFDASSYTRAPAVDVPSGYALGIALLRAMPHEFDASSPMRSAARRLRSALEALREAWALRERLGGSVDRRPFDVAADAAWRALNGRLQSAAMLGGTPELDAIAKEARDVLDVVFTGGLAFTQLPYASQWAHSERLLTSFDAATAARIDRIAGEPYLAYVRQTHAAFGEAIRITVRAGDSELAGGVREPLRAVQVAIQEYVFGLLATLPPSRPASGPLLRQALAPLEAHRASQSRGSMRLSARDPEAGEPALAPPAEPAGPAPTDPIPAVD